MGRDVPFDIPSNYPCKYCGYIAVTYYEFEGSYHYTCQKCKKDWWIEGFNPEDVDTWEN